MKEEKQDVYTLLSLWLVEPVWVEFLQHLGRNESCVAGVTIRLSLALIISNCDEVLESPLQEMAFGMFPIAEVPFSEMPPLIPGLSLDSLFAYITILLALYWLPLEGTMKLEDRFFGMNCSSSACKSLFGLELVLTLDRISDLVTWT